MSSDDRSCRGAYTSNVGFQPTPRVQHHALQANAANVPPDSTRALRHNSIGTHTQLSSPEASPFPSAQ